MGNFQNPLELKQDQIVVWFAGVDRPLPEIKELEALLSPQETARAHRFCSARDRDRYTVQHGVLRSLLAGYLGCAPGQVDMRSSANGKPCVVGREDEGSLQFSVSHSDAFGAYAFTIVGSIGVDVEKICEFPDMLEIVEQHFTLRESHEMLSCPEDQRLMLFYRFWTRKEAVLKAQGEGLLRALGSVDVATGEGIGPWKVSLADRTFAEEYLLADIEAPPGFCAAVAVASSLTSISISVNFMKDEKLTKFAPLDENNHHFIAETAK